MDGSPGLLWKGVEDVRARGYRDLPDLKYSGGQHHGTQSNMPLEIPPSHSYAAGSSPGSSTSSLASYEYILGSSRWEITCQPCGRDPAEVPGSWLLPGIVLTVPSDLAVNQKCQIDLSLCLSDG